MTKIEWVKNQDGTQGKTWNPVTGCTKISPGCAHCFAERMAHRLAGHYGYPESPNQFKVTLHPDKLFEPLTWKKPSMIFVDSMGDLFHKDVPTETLFDVFAVMAEAHWHTFQLLTKRPERMRDFVQRWLDSRKRREPLDNVWLGVSAENQATADERIPLLLQTSAVVRFASAEPMLGPLNLAPYLTCVMVKGPEIDYPPGTIHGVDNPPKRYGARLRPCLDWVICGCESGPSARPADIEWAASLMYQCQDSHTPFFFKQWMFGIKNLVKLPLLKGKVWDQFPEVAHV